MLSCSFSASLDGAPRGSTPTAREFTVYCHTSPSGKCYVGYSVRGLDVRWAQHVCDAKRGSRLPFHRAIRKYGAGAFRSEVLAQVATEAEAKALEIECIAAAGSVRPNGYNVTVGGEGASGAKRSEATRARMRVAAKVRQALNPSRSSPEAAAKISDALRGRRLPEESLRAMRASWTPERKEAASKRASGRRHSAETRAKIAAAHTGKTKSAEHRAALSAALIGTRLRQETKDKLAATSRAAWTPERRARQAALMTAVNKGWRKNVL